MKRELNKERSKLLHAIEKLLEGPMLFLGFVWLLLLVIEFIWGLPTPLVYLGYTIWVLFLVDFLVKFFLAPGKLSFLKKNWLTAVSLLIPALRLFRIFRVMRMLQGLRGIRLVRVVSSLNRSMKSLSSTMRRRGFAYVMMLVLIATFAGAAGMYGMEKGNPGFENYGMAVWWTAMRITTAGSDFWPQTPEGRGLALILTIFGYVIFGYVTATLASYFVGRDAEEEGAPVAGASDVAALEKQIAELTKSINEMKGRLPLS